MFDLEASQLRASQDLRAGARRRSDAGRSRLSPEVLRELQLLVREIDRPSMAELRRDLTAACRARGLRPPSRASLYNLLPRLDGNSYQVAALPPHVAATLHNLAPDSRVPGHQLVYHCLCHGSLAAASFAAGLPWLDLYQAWHRRGWPPRSRALLRATLRVRGIR